MGQETRLFRIKTVGDAGSIARRCQQRVRSSP
jgi:hypothetical protein